MLYYFFVIIKKTKTHDDMTTKVFIRKCGGNGLLQTDALSAENVILTRHLWQTVSTYLQLCIELQPMSEQLVKQRRFKIR